MNDRKLVHSRNITRKGPEAREGLDLQVVPSGQRQGTEKWLSELGSRQKPELKVLRRPW